MKGARGRNPVSGHFPYHGLAYNQKPKEERMASVNKVILVGNLGKDPELSYTPSGVAVCKFSVATTDKWAGQDGSLHEKTEWHRIVVWKKTAENCAKYLRKGSPAYIEGRLQTRSWDDLQSGQKRYSTEIVADNVKFLGSAQGAAREAPPVPNSAAPDWDMPAEGGSMDDVPF